MNLKIRKRATLSMRKVANWIDEKSTEGAGDRWLASCVNELTDLAKIGVILSICKDPNLARYNYRCYTYKDKWVAAYRIKGDSFIVYRFIYGPWLTYHSAF